MIRGLLWAAYFHGLTAVMGVGGLLVRAFARERALAYARLWIRCSLAGLRWLGIDWRVTGAEHLPRDGAALIASQHQSAFDTLVWFLILSAPSYVMKRELTRIPLFGPLLVPAGMIPVDRAGGAAALRQVLEATAAAAAAGRQIVIFPEGTRLAPGARVPLQPGIAAIAARVRLPVVPVATDSGWRWPRGSLRRYAGTIHVAVGAPIPVGTPRAALLAGIEAHWRACEARGFGPAA